MFAFIVFLILFVTLFFADVERRFERWSFANLFASTVVAFCAVFLGKLVGVAVVWTFAS